MGAGVTGEGLGKVVGLGVVAGLGDSVGLGVAAGAGNKVGAKRESFPRSVCGMV